MAAHRRDGETHPFTREELVRMLQDVWIEHGVVPTFRDADAGRFGLPSGKVFQRKFGSFNAAKQEARFSIDPRGGWQRDEKHDNIQPNRKRATKIRGTL